MKSLNTRVKESRSVQITVGYEGSEVCVLICRHSALKALRAVCSSDGQMALADKYVVARLSVVLGRVSIGEW